MNCSPYFSLKPPVDSTLTGPARLHLPWAMTILTPGCSRSVVLNTCMHSCALSMVYRSLTLMMARISPVPPSARAISSPALIDSSSVESVTGIGQNRPLAIFMPSHTPCQSEWVMKPSSGVKPPMPSMMISPASRELTFSRGSVVARARSDSSAPPWSRSGLRALLPWGLTSAMRTFPPVVVDLVLRRMRRLALPRKAN